MLSGFFVNTALLIKSFKQDIKQNLKCQGVIVFTLQKAKNLNDYPILIFGSGDLFVVYFSTGLHLKNIFEGSILLGESWGLYNWFQPLLILIVLQVKSLFFVQKNFITQSN